MLNRPDHLAWAAGIFITIIIGAGLMVSALMEKGADGGTQSDYFTGYNTSSFYTTSLGGSMIDAANATDPDEGQSEEPTEANIIKDGFQNLLNLGKVYSATKEHMIKGSTYLSIPPILWMMGIGLIIITFSVIIYTWIRGS